MEVVTVAVEIQWWWLWWKSAQVASSWKRMNEAAKNARLLENYKAIKVGQLQKEKEKQQHQLLRY
jgi:hypothetical protein